MLGSTPTALESERCVNHNSHRIEIRKSQRDIDTAVQLAKEWQP